MNKAPLLFVIGLIFCTAICRGQETKLNVIYAGKVSVLSLPASAIGEDWEGPTGLVVDDFKDLSHHPKDVKPIVEELKKQLTPIGVVGTADFTYRKKSDPVHQVTLRVFLFDDASSCQSWWTKKYRYEGWEKHYTVVGGLPYNAVDSTQMTKRAIAFGNIWMTCSAPDAAGDHVRVLDLCVNKIKIAAEGK